MGFFKKCNAVFISDSSNLYYFSRYQNADAVIILTPDKSYYLTDARCFDEATGQVKGFQIVDIKDKSLIDAAIILLKLLNVKSLGACVDIIGFKEHKALSKGFKIVSVDDEIIAKRAVKTPEEIELIKKAQSITERVFNSILGFISVGQTEIEVASKINALIYENGCSLAFDTIVAFSENTAKPHAHPSSKKLQKNDIILLDYGAKYMGYCSDMSRSLTIGSVCDLYKERYNMVLEAQELALKGLKAGISGINGDAFARNYFKEKGVSGNFTHSLGHSLGIDIHESPRLSPRFDGVIPQNAVMSVEPGLYFKNEMGIRIEDIVIFEKDSIFNLTNSPKSLIIL